MIDVVVYFFILGAVAGLLKAELRLPPAVYDLVSTILLLAIGLKGGLELSRHASPSIALQSVAVLALGIVLTLIAFGILRWLGKLDRANAASIAAHYGSVSVATFAVGAAYLAAREIPYDGQLALFVVLLEIPGIVVGIWLARARGSAAHWQPIMREIFLGRGVVLLVGGLLIGWIAGAEGLAPISPLFIGLFKGILALFLLEMGLIAADQLTSFRKRGPFLAVFAIAVPVMFSTFGAALGFVLGLSLGGTILLATLAASASYIAAPAAIRTGIPEANAGLSLTAVLGITFPFNILIGIPFYERIARWMLSTFSGD